MADTKLSALTAKATPVAADILHILDSAASNADKRTTAGALPVSTAQAAADAVVLAAAKGLPLALTGAVAATRYVGGTASVAPTTGTFAVGDYVITQAGGIYICTVAGTPGTWVAVTGGAAGVTVQDEGTPLATTGTTLNFVGAGVAASGTGATKTITITGTAAALDDLTDATIASPGGGQGFHYDPIAGLWKNIPIGIFFVEEYANGVTINNGAGNPDAAIAAAIAAAKAAGNASDTNRAAVVEFGPGGYAVRNPVVLPRGGDGADQLIHLSGAHMNSTSIRGHSSFPTGRAVIEWDKSAATKCWGQRISDITIVAPSVANTRCIHYELTVDSLTTDYAHINAERLQLDLINVRMEGSNQYHPDLCYLRGGVWYSTFDGIYGDPSQNTPTYDTLLFKFDYQINGADPNMSTDAPGFAYSQMRNCYASFRKGGYASFIKGRIFRSKIDHTFCNAGRQPSVDYWFINSHASRLADLGDEGQSSTLFRFEKCEALDIDYIDTGAPGAIDAVWQASHVYALNALVHPVADSVNQQWKVTTAGTSSSGEPSWPGSPTVGVTTQTDGTVTWTYQGPEVGNGIELINCQMLHFNKHKATAGSPLWTSYGVKLLTMDTNCDAIVCSDWEVPYNPTAHAGDEFTLTPAASKYRIYGINRTGAGTGINGERFVLGTFDPAGYSAVGGGSGDVVGPSSSVDAEVALFNSTTGKLIKRATGSGIAKLTSGVLSAVTAPSGAIVGDTDTQTLSGKTLTTPTIGSFANAAHDHTNAAGGAQLTSAALSNFSEAVDDRVAALVVAGNGLVASYDDSGNLLTLGREDPGVVVDLIEDFIGGGTSGGQIGTHGWNTIAGAATTYPTAVAGHPGMIQRGTSATQSTVAAVYTGNNGTSAQGPIVGTDLWDITFLLRLNTNDSDTILRVGWTSAPATQIPAEGAYLEKLAADTNWFRVARSASTQTRTDTTIATTGTWAACQVYKKANGDIGYKVAATLAGLPGATEQTQSTNVPTAVAGNPFVQIVNPNTAVNKTVDIDYARVRVTGISR